MQKYFIFRQSESRTSWYYLTAKQSQRSACKEIIGFPKFSYFLQKMETLLGARHVFQKFAVHIPEIEDKAMATLGACTNIESMGMNRDEWLAAGLSNAEAADAEEYDCENKCSLLKKAVFCFE